MFNARTFQDDISSRLVPVQENNELIGFNGFGFAPPPRRCIFPAAQRCRQGLQTFGNFTNHGNGVQLGIGPTRPRSGNAVRLGLQRFNNVPAFGAHRQDLNFLDRKGLLGLDVVDRVGQSKSEKIYNHLFMFYRVLIILK